MAWQHILIQDVQVGDVVDYGDETTPGHVTANTVVPPGEYHPGMHKLSMRQNRDMILPPGTYVKVHRDE